MLARTWEARLMFESLRNTHQVHDNNCAHFFIFHILQKKWWNVEMSDWLFTAWSISSLVSHRFHILLSKIKQNIIYKTGAGIANVDIKALKSRPVNMEVLYMILLSVNLRSDTKDVIVWT